MKAINIEPSDIEAIYDGLNHIGALGDTPEAGFNRPAYSNAETDAMQHIESLANAENLNARWDTVGNLIIETPGNFSEWIETGSHIDTVSGGGNFDGTAGVVAGLAVLQKVQCSGMSLNKGLRLRVWRGEESAAFGVVSIGSRAAFGNVTSNELEATHRGQPLADAIRTQNVGPEPIRQGIPSITDNERDTIAAHIELHIEQGAVLESNQADIGIVTGIRGSIRSWVKLRGAFDHSGATPMGRPYRCDVNLAMAYMQVALDKLAQQAIAEGEDIVQTVGVINCNPDSDFITPSVTSNEMTKVSGTGYFSHEVRSVSSEFCDSFTNIAFAIMKKIGGDHGVSVEIDTISKSPGIPKLDPALQTLAKSACQQLNLNYKQLPSGAWHDAAVLCSVKRSDGSAIPVGMLFIPCRNGISHSADEFSSPQQIAVGASTLAHMMISLAG